MRLPHLSTLLLLLLPASVLAQGPAAAALDVNLTLKSVSCRGPHAAIKHDNQCMLGDGIQLDFDNLPEWIKADPVRHDPRQLVIALNGRAIPDTRASVMAAGGNTLTFDLTPPEGSDPDSDASRLAWREILHGHSRQTTMSVFVGLKGGNVFYGPLSLTFEMYPAYAWVVFVLIGLVAVSVAWLAVHSNLIRSPGPDPGPGQMRPYSLGRMQMAWWFVLVIGSYLYIWLITQNQDSLTAGVLILTGISAATGLGSVVAGGGGTSAATPPALDGAAPPVVKPAVSRGLLHDLLGTESGVSFDRFQMAAWTVVLGLVFVRQVIGDLSMPDFSPTLLSLMGISSGTYIGFKLPGKSG